ncbi:MAG: hypothetical protein IJ057_09580 [Bacteroidales bacterium]|nr:hypothetical protein [Bacteroidales bacterium]
MEYYNNILTVEAGWMIEQGVMSKANYEKLGQRGDIQVVRRACRNTPALVAYDSMPDRYKRAIVERVGDPRKEARQNVLEGLIEHSATASEYFENYMIDDDRHLPADKRREYYTNAIVLDGVRRLIEGRNSKRKALGNRATRFWDEISDAVQELDLTKWPHTLPANARSLERKYQRYLSEGFASLVHKAYQTGSKNAAKVADENQKAMLVTFMSDPRNLDNEQVARLYNMVAQQMDWKEITASAVAVWRDKCDDLIFARRHGAEKYRAGREMQVKRSAPTRPLLFWTMDGWDVELLYQNKPDKGATTYHNRLTMVVVLDGCCRYPIGFAVGHNESPALIREALRDAERETQRLFGRMYRVGQLQSDHFAMKNLTPTYQTVADKVTPARVKNAKAKPIEAWFNYFNKKYCQMQTNWSGFGITSRKELQPNTEYITKYKHQFPDFEGCVRQIVGFIQAERAELETAYVAQFEAEGLIELKTAQYLMAFGESTGERRYLLQGCGIRCTIGTRKMDYDCFDTHFRKYPSTRWQLRYDPEDLHYAVAVNEDESLQFTLEEKYIQPMALADRKEGDARELQRVMDFNRRKEQELMDELTPMEDRARELLEQTTLSKLLITDSRGQHKLPKAKARLAAANAELVEAEETGDNFYDMY